MSIRAQIGPESGLVTGTQAQVGFRGSRATQAKLATPNRLPAAARASHMESADDYHRVVAHLNDAWRIIVCGDRIQWVLQSWRAPLWRNRSYCMTSAALRREARKVCRDSAAWQTLLTLPEHIKDAEDERGTADSEMKGRRL